MKEVKSYTNEDYEKLYGIPDYKDKVVLEVGAEVGSTAYFFQQKGARWIISIEGNRDRYTQLTKNVGPSDFSVVPMFEEIRTPEQLARHIKYYKPDILHMDCEGCECVLLGVEEEIFCIPEVYQIEIHSPGIHDELLELWKRRGYIIPKDEEWTRGVWITVAKKDS